MGWAQGVEHLAGGVVTSLSLEFHCIHDSQLTLEELQARTGTPYFWTAINRATAGCESSKI